METNESQKSLPMTSPPRVVLMARQVTMLMLFVMNRTEPSHIEALTPPVCKLRAAIIRAREVEEGSRQGMSGITLGEQIPPVTTSCSLLLGAICVVNPA